MNIKIQLIGHATTRSAIEAKDLESTKLPLTFHAFSDTMKARMLESFLKPENKGRMAISFTNEEPRTGEWHEELVVGAAIN